ncbi:MAG: tyrosine-type recombinase/integrase [Thermodesulforhabdaceae bacterium]
MKDVDLSERTTELALATVRMAFNKAKDWGIFDGENPVSKVQIPRKDNRRPGFLTPREAYVLLGKVRRRSRQAYEMCLLVLHCGLRFGEIANLNWGDIDTQGGIIYILHTRSQKQHHQRCLHDR